MKKYGLALLLINLFSIGALSAERSVKTITPEETEAINEALAELGQRLDLLKQLGVAFVTYPHIHPRARIAVVQRLSEENNVIRSMLNDSQRLSPSDLLTRLRAASAYVTQLLRQFAQFFTQFQQQAQQAQANGQEELADIEAAIVQA